MAPRNNRRSANNQSASSGQNTQHGAAYRLTTGLILPVLKIFSNKKEVDDAKASRDTARETYTNTKKGLGAQLSEAKSLVKTHRLFNKAKRELIRYIASAERSDATLAVEERKGELMSELIDHSKDVRIQAAENKAIAARELITQKVLGGPQGNSSGQSTKSLPWKS